MTYTTSGRLIAGNLFDVAAVGRMKTSAFRDRFRHQPGLVVEVVEPSLPVVPSVVIRVDPTADSPIDRLRRRQVVNIDVQPANRRFRVAAQPVQAATPLLPPHAVNPVLGGRPQLPHPQRVTVELRTGQGSADHLLRPILQPLIRVDVQHPVGLRLPGRFLHHRQPLPAGNPQVRMPRRVHSDDLVDPGKVFASLVDQPVGFVPVAEGSNQLRVLRRWVYGLVGTKIPLGGAVVGHDSLSSARRQAAAMRRSHSFRNRTLPPGLGVISPKMPPSYTSTRQNGTPRALDTLLAVSMTASGSLGR